MFCLPFLAYFDGYSLPPSEVILEFPGLTDDFSIFWAHCEHLHHFAQVPTSGGFTCSELRRVFALDQPVVILPGEGQVCIFCQRKKRKPLKKVYIAAGFLLQSVFG